MIQLYAKRSDIIPSEKIGTDELFYSEVLEFCKQLDKEGMRDSLKIKPNGYVIRGNERLYWLDQQQPAVNYVPIDLGYYLGLMSTTTGILLRKSILSEVYKANSFNIPTPIKPPNTFSINIETLKQKTGMYLIDHRDTYKGFIARDKYEANLE